MYTKLCRKWCLFFFILVRLIGYISMVTRHFFFEKLVVFVVVVSGTKNKKKEYRDIFDHTEKCDEPISVPKHSYI